MRGPLFVESRELARLRWILELSAWSRATSSQENSWSIGNVALGQAEATALVVQDLLGGQLLRVGVWGTPHVWNLIGSFEADLTRDQFTAGFRPDGVPQVIGRAEVLSLPGSRRRYFRLLGRLGAAERHDLFRAA